MTSSPARRKRPVSHRPVNVATPRGRCSVRVLSRVCSLCRISPAVLLLCGLHLPVAAQDSPLPSLTPLVRVVDLAVGETAEVELSNGERVVVKLTSLDEHRDAVCNAMRRAEVGLEIDGRLITLVAATYHRPQRTGRVQVDCSVTRGYNLNGRPASWGLDKDARIRLWPANSPLVRPGTFAYPAKQRWFASLTQMANVPTYVDGGEDPDRQTIYYHSGLDIGGAEGRVEVTAATEGLVVSVGDEVLAGHREETPVAPRYDVVYLLDARGWYYRYSHLKQIDAAVKPGRVVSIGDRIGWLGKEGGSGGWSHLHFEIKARQPSGKWGTQAGYALLWEAYERAYQPQLIAVARPHHFIWAGDLAVLDASKSWSADGADLKFTWTFTDGGTQSGPQINRVYPESGSFSEIVKVTDPAGNVSYDFAVVQVIDREHGGKLPPTIHPAYYPTRGIRAGTPVEFLVRSFRTQQPEETWHFGDGTPAVVVHSDGNANMHDPQGYAVTTHSFADPGDYIVRVETVNEHHLPAVGHLHVRVDP